MLPVNYNESIPICINCIYVDKKTDYYNPRCRHPSIWTIDVVYGSITKFLSCQTMRESDLCGIEGKLFEKKE